MNIALYLKYVIPVAVQSYNKISFIAISHHNISNFRFLWTKILYQNNLSNTGIKYINN